MNIPLQNQDKILKQTSSLCPVCRAPVPAVVYQSGEEVFLRKNCKQHGSFEAVINSDSTHYHLSHGAGLTNTDQLPLLPADACETGSCCGTSAESLSTCVGLIEIVNSCNLECPVCFADSPHPDEVDALPFDEFCKRVKAVIDRKGAIDILQLSGGEPTIHPEFFRLLEWSLAHEEIGHVLLNTNGIKLLSDSFFETLTEQRKRLGKLEVYLQFDGLQEDGQRELRGVDLREQRSRVVQRCAAAGVPVNLAMTVDQHNLRHLGAVLEFAVAHPVVSGITWQPMFGSGRAYSGFNLVNLSNSIDDVQRPPQRRLNVADIIKAAVEQSNGRLETKDFTPLPCGDPNCHTVAYLLRRGENLVSLASMIDLSSMQGFLKDRLNYDVNDLLQCGCESEPLGEILKQLEIGPESVLRLVIKPFMDVWTYDQHRVDRCCVHVIGENGQLKSFCQHYATS